MANTELGRVVVNSSSRLMNNVISGEKLRSIQSRVLQDLKESIIHSMGPAGSNSLLLRGSSDADIVAEYSKDGNRIIKHIKYQYPIELAIKSEIENATRYIEREVGDGTSSIVVLSSLIFDALCKAEKDGKLSKDPYETMRIFKQVVSEISQEIKKMGRECTLDDIYDIAYISTNGNTEVAELLRSIYQEYGMNVFIDVSASTNENTYVKSYNGVTIEAGYADPAMINNIEHGSARIRSTSEYPVHVYHFAEPIDTPEQLAFFQTIIESNIVERRFNKVKPTSEIPTVILVPKISRDAQAYMRRITLMLHQFDESMYSQKPQLLIITNYGGLNENYVDHISTLCGCKPIKKYIDDKIQKQDQDNGLAPTLKNVCDFYGTVGEVEADSVSSKFVDPVLMYEQDDDGHIIVDEKGSPVYSRTYNNIVNFIKAEYQSLSSQGGHAGALGALKRQLNAIQSNMVELFIGGISISDRDSLRDLVEDAVLNTRSAAKNGVGYGANTMGFCVTTKWLQEKSIDESKEIFVRVINDAYCQLIKALYSTVMSNDDYIMSVLQNIIDHEGKPFNIGTKPDADPYDGKVLTSIESEPAILNTIAKLITIMFTANQAILQTPALAVHY